MFTNRFISLCMLSCTILLSSVCQAESSHKDCCNLKETDDPAFSCCKLGFEITDALERDADAVFPNMKDNASRVFISYAKVPANLFPADIEAELFANNNGTLTSLNTVLYDASFPAEGLAVAAPSFNNLFLLDSDNATSIRLRKYDSDLNFTGQQVIFNDYADDASLEAAISADGKFLAVTYLVSLAPPVTLIRVIDTQTLQTVDTTTVPGLTNGPRWFTLKDKHKCQLYFSLATVDFDVGFATLHVFKFKKGEIISVDTAPLPSFANIPAITSGCCGEVLIATGGRQAFDSLDAPSVFPEDLVAARQTFIPGDTANLRLYSFSCKKLNLIYSETLPAEATRGITFHPNNKCLLVSQTPPGVAGVTGAVASFRCVQICKDKCAKTKRADASISSSASTIVFPTFNVFNPFNFSEKGEWFITGGASNTGVCETNPGFRNINLYRVNKIDAPCKDH